MKKMNAVSMRNANGGKAHYWVCNKCGAAYGLIKAVIRSHCKKCSGDPNNYTVRYY